MQYNKKLSGAKAVFVPITQVGKNYLPFVEDLRDRYIKYIDFYPVVYLPDTTATGTQSSADIYFTIADKTGNAYLVKEMPLDRFNYMQTTGIRQAICAKMSLQNSYLTNMDSNNIGTVAMLIFWYDLPEFSAANSTEYLITDSLSIPLTTAIRQNTLPDELRMAQKRFRRILLGAPSYTPDYQQALTSSELSNIYLTLRKGSYNVVENVPVVLLYQLWMIEKAEFSNIIFDLQSSFLTIGGANTIPNVQTDYIGKNVFFNFVYEK